MSRILKAPDIRRQELIDIGFDLYMKKGAAGLSIKEIVNKAEVATGLFYYYFKSKEEFIDEALNDFVVKNIKVIETILRSEELTTMQKAENAFCAFWNYAERVAPYRNESTFQMEQHYKLTNKLLTQMQPIFSKIIADGTADGVFHVSNPPLTAGFMLYGLSSILNTPITINREAKEELNRLVFSLLGIA